jgi:hypothetical protein
VTTQQAARPIAPEFFDEMRSNWREAVETTGPEQRRYRVAGLALELQCAGTALVGPLTRALAHLPAPDPEADSLVVHAWDSKTTGTTVPRPPWTNGDYREHGRIRGFFDERFQSVYQWGSHSLVMLDVERSEAVYWVAAPEQIPYFEMAAPLRLALHGWLETRDVQLIHAAAIGSGDGCVLIAGKSGSGKSWTTLAASSSGLRMLADDYCLLYP